MFREDDLLKYTIGMCVCAAAAFFYGRLKTPVVNLLSLMSGPLQRLESLVA